MTETATCASCGEPLTGDGVGGLCPRCLLYGMSGRERPTPPTPERVAEMLPGFTGLELMEVGGMGFVYKAHQTNLDRPVAIKVLPLELSVEPEFRERFMQEARTLAGLNHPNIVTIHDFGEAGEFVFLVMELVEGTNLTHLIRSRKLTPARALAMVPQMCDALEFAHSKGIVHRDIKPSNILVGEGDHVKIADFGIAKAIRGERGDDPLTMGGSAMGTLAYMAPEQLSDPSHVDHRADIYSLGAVIYEMLTGELPVGHFAPPSKKVEVDVQMDKIVLKALVNEPDGRFQYVREVKDGVEGVANKAPVRHGSRRRWILAGLGVAVALAAVAVTFPWPGRGSSDGAAGGGHGDQPPPAPPPIAIVGGDVCASIDEALEKVRPGQTIRVAGDATHKIALNFQHPNHRDVVFEGVDGATLAPMVEDKPVFRVLNTGGVTVRGFRISNDGAKENTILTVVFGRSPGVVFENLKFEAAVPRSAYGLSLERIEVAEGETPVVIRDCHFKNLKSAVRVSALDTNTFKDATPGRGMLIVDNTFEGTSNGVSLLGGVEDVVVAGNIFDRNGQAALRAMSFFPQSANLLLANNTFFECGEVLRVMDDGLIDGGDDVVVVNNLSLATAGLDWAIYDTDDLRRYGNPGDAAGLHARWTISHNWREGQAPDDADPMRDYSIPPGEDDISVQRVDGVGRDRAAADFLQPAAQSPLASRGAGGTVEGVPVYVGALPAPGGQRWQWQLTTRRTAADDDR